MNEEKELSSHKRGSYNKKKESTAPKRKYEVHTLSSHQKPEPEPKYTYKKVKLTIAPQQPIASTSKNINVKVQEPKKSSSEINVVKREFITTDLSRRDVPGTSTSNADSMFKIPKIKQIPDSKLKSSTNLIAFEKGEKRCITVFSEKYEAELNKKFAQSANQASVETKNPPEMKRYRITNSSSILQERKPESIKSVSDSNKKVEVKSAVATVTSSRKAETAKRIVESKNNKKQAAAAKRRTTIQAKNLSKWKRYPVKAAANEQKKTEIKTGPGWKKYDVKKVAETKTSSAKAVAVPEPSKKNEIKPITERKKPGPKPKKKTEAQLAAEMKRKEKIASAAAAAAAAAASAIASTSTSTASNRSQPKKPEPKFSSSKRVLAKKAFKPKHGPKAEIVDFHFVPQPTKPTETNVVNGPKKSDGLATSELKKPIPSSSKSVGKSTEMDEANNTASATTSSTNNDDFVFKKPLPINQDKSIATPDSDAEGSKQPPDSEKKMQERQLKFFTKDEVEKVEKIIETKLKVQENGRKMDKDRKPLVTTIEEIFDSDDTGSQKEGILRTILSQTQSEKEKAQKEKGVEQKPIDIEELKQYNEMRFSPIYPKKELKYFNTFVKYRNRRYQENLEEIEKLEKMRDEAGNDSVLIGITTHIKDFNVDEAITPPVSDEDEPKDKKDKNSKKRTKRTKTKKKKRSVARRTRSKTQNQNEDPNLASADDNSTKNKDNKSDEQSGSDKAAQSKVANRRTSRSKKTTAKSAKGKRSAKSRQASEASKKRWAKRRADLARTLAEEEKTKINKEIDADPACIDKGQSMTEELEEELDDLDLDKHINVTGSFCLKKLESTNSSKSTKKRKHHERVIVDDGDPDIYKRRMSKYKKMLAKMDPESREMETKLVKIGGDFYVPQKIWHLLFEFQREAVKWLCQLHVNLIGGILGDEMGLGKTVSLIVFLVALSNSKHLRLGEVYVGKGPVILICPVTVMQQWVKEFHRWYPKFRVSILHQSGSNKGKSKASLIRDTVQRKEILITSYKSLAAYQELILKHDWQYVILDEGHRIRNPDAQITNICKRFETCHRLILTGTPIQNNLKEFWSLIDFVCPGKLGLLPSFEKNIAIPIRKGCSRDATDLDRQIAYRCTSMLYQTVGKSILRRTKDLVQFNLQLPLKKEQICLCRLTDVQKECYTDFLAESYPKFFRDDYIDRVSMFKFMIQARKICNHPYLYSKEYATERMNSTEFFHQSSKMIVLEALLKHWHDNGHRVLLFAQGVKTLDLIENFVRKKLYMYFRMDGQTPIKDRQEMIKSFNEDENMFIFLLTTRVGGVGVTLTGADRVVIFDPDWNPCTDMQAKERCWRIGQQRDVMIYRLLTAGTIEERIFQRQEFKCFLSDQILKTPNHKSFMKMDFCKNLFSLNDCSETSIIQYDTKVKLELKRKYENIPEDKKQLSEATKLLPKIPKKTTATEEVPEKQEIAKEGDKMDIDWTKIPIQLSEEKKKELLARARKICESFSKDKENPRIDDDGVAPKPLTEQDEQKPKPKSSLNYLIQGKPESGLSIQLLANNENRPSGMKIEDCYIDYLVETYDATPTTTNPDYQKMAKGNIDPEFYFLQTIGGSSVSSLQDCENEKLSDKNKRELVRKGEDVSKVLIEKFEEDKSKNNRLKLKPTDPINSSLFNPLFFVDLNSKARKFLDQFKRTLAKDEIVKDSVIMEENLELATALILFFHKRMALSGASSLSTEEIIREFRAKTRPDQSPILRSMIYGLAEIADYSGDSEETKFWQLKSDYKITNFHKSM